MTPTLCDAPRRGNGRTNRRHRQKPTVTPPLWHCDIDGPLMVTRIISGNIRWAVPTAVRLTAPQDVIYHVGHILLSLTYLLDPKIKHTWPRFRVASS